MSTEIEKVMEKIEKLLRLSESPNEAEAAAATAKARQLLVEYNLSLEEVTARGEKVNREVTEEVVNAINSVMQNWEVDLAGVISRSFFSKVILSGKSKFFFVGEAHDIEVTIFTFNQLRIRLQEMAYKATQERNEEFKRLHGISPRYLTGANHPKTWRTSWLNGAVHGIYAKLTRERQTDSSQVTSIVVHKDEQIARFVQETHGRLESRASSRSTGNTSAYSRGYSTGSSMDIHAGLTGAQAPQLRGS